MKNYAEIPQNTPFTLVLMVNKEISTRSYDCKADFLDDIDVITESNPDGAYTNVREWEALSSGLQYAAFVSKPHHFEQVCKDLKCREILTHLIKGHSGI